MIADASRITSTEIPVQTEYLPWYKVWVLALSRPNAERYTALLAELEPSRANACMWVLLAALAGQIILQSLFVAFTGFDWLAGQASLVEIAFISAIYSVPRILVMVVVLFTIFFACAVGHHLFATLIGGKGRFTQLLCLSAAYTAPLILIQLGLTMPLEAIVPGSEGIMNFIFGLLTLGFSIVAIRAVYRLSTWKAVVPALAVLAITTGITMNFLIVFGPALQEMGLL